MIAIKDLSQYAKDRWGLYGGLSGSKYGILIDGVRWMVKFPENTKHFPGREKRNHHIPSYTSSPVSEYIGSKIYESLGIPVHETMLGYRDGKIVVACRDFDPYRAMIDYGKIKNAVTENDANLTGSSDRHGIGRCPDCNGNFGHSERHAECKRTILGYVCHRCIYTE